MKSRGEAKLKAAVFTNRGVFNITSKFLLQNWGLQVRTRLMSLIPSLKFNRNGQEHLPIKVHVYSVWTLHYSNELRTMDSMTDSKTNLMRVTVLAI